MSRSAALAASPSGVRASRFSLGFFSRPAPSRATRVSEVVSVCVRRSIDALAHLTSAIRAAFEPLSDTRGADWGSDVFGSLPICTYNKL